MSAHWTHSLCEGRALLLSPWKRFLPSTYFAPYSLPCGMSFVVSSEKLHFSRTEVMSFWETPSRAVKELSKWQRNNQVHFVPWSDYKYEFTKKCYLRTGTVLPKPVAENAVGTNGTWLLIPLGHDHLGNPGRGLSHLLSLLVG